MNSFSAVLEVAGVWSQDGIPFMVPGARQYPIPASFQFSSIWLFIIDNNQKANC